MFTLNKNQKILDYTIIFPIKEGEYAENYRVKDVAGNNYFLKLINYSKLDSKQFDEYGNVLELKIVQQLHNDNCVRYHDGGDVILMNQKFCFIVFDFISGETLSERIARQQWCSIYDAKQIVIGILQGLKYLHSMPNPIIHNELSLQNIMLDLSNGIPQTKIIDFGHARFMNQDARSLYKQDINPFYMAPECINGIFTPQSDLFSVGAILYHLLYGRPPWFVTMNTDNQTVVDVVRKERQKPLKILNRGNDEADEQLINILLKATSINIDDRFKSADEFLQALNGNIQIDRVDREGNHSNTVSKSNIKEGNGFKDVAGMSDLKEQLYSDVIELLKHPQRAKELGLALPNGLLFYGPPGCGKTYFAEKFAEELSCNYMYIKCSDVASPYIHGGQEKIAAIFEQARKNAPTILFFDEIDAMIKDRSKHNNVSESGEVNEFLAQLNNCGKDGVIVIGATNKPLDIDTAALRSGRLEYKYYIPLPDKETRKSLFEIHLQNRKRDFSIDYDILANKTEGYISSDINLIVTESARMVFRKKLPKITMEILLAAIDKIKPSLSREIIEQYEDVRKKFEGERERTPVGFKF